MEQAATCGFRDRGHWRCSQTADSAIGCRIHVVQRRKRSKANGDNANGRLTRHVLSDDVFAATDLSKLRSTTIENWRDGLVAADSSEVGALSPASVNRLLNDLRAALNAAALKHRRELPAHVFQEIKHGTKSLEAPDAARRQLLTDSQVVALVNAAFDVDDTGDFGRLITVLAASGARHSQVAALRVFSFQHNQQRLMMPGSRKGAVNVRNHLWRFKAGVRCLCAAAAGDRRTRCGRAVIGAVASRKKGKGRLGEGVPAPSGALK